MAGMSTGSDGKRVHSFEVAVQAMEETDGLPPVGWTEAWWSVPWRSRRHRPGSRVSVVFAGDDVVRDLNREHRGLDETTDVLAFSFAHEGEYYGEPDGRVSVEELPGFALPPGQPEPLGEVIVSTRRRFAQAAEAGRTVRGELAALLAHGVLHLLGYDHMDPGDEAVDEGPGKPGPGRPVIGYAA